MRLTQFSDYSLRVLMFLATAPKDELSSIQQIADAYGISKNHLMKVTHQLGKWGFVETIRGRNGGLRLAKDPKDINVGEVVRHTEEDFHVVECFDTGACVLADICHLRGVLGKALQAFFEVLDEYTLADLTQNRSYLQTLLMKSE
ncbi:BadM/Rrf2 family transcriptional regulator [Bacillus oleivorans]|uniref:HTH-type transcriptional regulator NsrR n=1 Tax=Bacillus oleivorans TaxID=1448271 RepID=A0A285CHQ4_9BACI|nr:Rrf2 family transcriptional regulator [Bacillus oleivorans]SNX67040.1 BadM/Rrf2 family transcriptional regulator [Bacillus oleivorans]